MGELSTLSSSSSSSFSSFLFEGVRLGVMAMEVGTTGTSAIL